MGEIILDTGINTSGLKAGSDEMMNAIKGFGKKAEREIKSMTKRFIGIIAGVSSVISVMSKAVSSYMNNHKETAAQLQAAWGALGEVMGPIIEKIVNLITMVVGAFINFLHLLGISNKTAGQAAKDAQGAAGAIQKSLMGFDELNKLSDGGGGGASGSLSDEIPKWLEEIGNLIKQGLWEEAGRTLGRKLNEMVESVDWDGIGRKIGYYFDGALKFLYGAIDEFDFYRLGKHVSEMLSSFLESVDWTYLGRVVVSAITGIFDYAIGILTNMKWANVAKAIADIIIGAFTEFNTWITDKDWALIGEQIVQGFKDFFGVFGSEGGKGAEITTAFSTAMGSLLKAGVDFAGTIVSDIWDGLKTAWNEYTLDEDGNFSLDKLKDSLKKAWANIGSWIRLNIVTPFFSALGIQFSNQAKTSSIIDWIDTFKTKIQTKLSSIDAPEALTNLVTAFNNVETGISNVGTAIAEFVSEHAPKLSTIYSDTIEPFFNKIFVGEGGKEATVTTLFGYIADAIDNLSKFIDEHWDSLQNLWNNFLSPFLDAMIDSTVSLVGTFANNMDLVAASLVSIGGVRIADSVLKFFGLGGLSGLLGGGGAAAGAAGATGAGMAGAAEAAETVTTAISGATAATAALGVALAALSGYAIYDSIKSFNDYKAAMLESITSTQDGQVVIEELNRQIAAQKAYIDSLSASGAIEGLQFEYDKLSDLQVLLAAATGKYNELLEAESKTISETGESIENAKDAVVEQANATESAVDSANKLADSVEEQGRRYTSTSEKAAIQGEAVNKSAEDTKAAAETVDTSMIAMDESIADGGKTAEESVEGTITTIESEFDAFLNNLETTVTTKTGDIVTAFTNAIAFLNPAVTNATLAVNNNFAIGMGIVAQNAFVWGSDLIILMNNGIVSAFNTYLIPTVAQVAQSIKDFLGFSEPKKGPLSNFHTFMPDMIQLMAEGIEDNEDIALDAVEGLANGISDEIQNGDYAIGKIATSDIDVAMGDFSSRIVNGFQNLIDTLLSIADTVAFSMPQVAMGGVVPYAVGNSASGNGRETSLEDVLMAIDNLRNSLISTGTENEITIPLKVDLDGKTISDTVTKYQRQNQRAKGK